MDKQKKILITGVSGYIGSHLALTFHRRGNDVYGIFRKQLVNALPFDKLIRADITDAGQIEALISKIKPDIIIHTSALSSLNECEKNQDLATKINVEGTKYIINSIQRVNSEIKLVFISSDYVFDGEKGNYKEDDDTNPTTFYGKTKAISEFDIKNNLNNFIICRTASVFGEGGNLFKFIVNALTNGREIEVYDDVFFTPTYIKYLIDSFEGLLEKDFRGIIHISGKERLTRSSFALKVAEALGQRSSLIRSIKQPANGLINRDNSLNTEYCQRLLKLFCPNLDKSLKYCFEYLVSPYFYFEDHRGKLIGITQNQKWEELNYVESVQGSIRGNHYHEDTIEGFYVLEGCVKVSLLKLSDNSKIGFNAGPGDFFIIQPRTLHKFEILTEAKWINMLSLSMNSAIKDIYTV